MISKLLAPFMPYILGASIAAVGTLTLMLWLANNKYDALVVDAATKIERAQANAANLEIIVGEQKASLETMFIEKGESRVRVQQQNEFAAGLQASLNEERLRNESYKSRWSNISSQRPEALARLANAATRKRVQFFAATTCRANCNKDNNNRNGSGASQEAGPNSSN